MITTEILQPNCFYSESVFLFEANKECLTQELCGLYDLSVDYANNECKTSCASGYACNFEVYACCPNDCANGCFNNGGSWVCCHEACSSCFGVWSDECCDDSCQTCSGSGPPAVLSAHCPSLKSASPKTSVLAVLTAPNARGFLLTASSVIPAIACSQAPPSPATLAALQATQKTQRLSFGLRSL